MLRDDLNKMPYTYQCIREAFRLHSPVPVISRELENEMVMDGVALKPGTMIGIMPVLVHHNEQVWGKDHNVRTVTAVYNSLSILT